MAHRSALILLAILTLGWRSAAAEDVHVYAAASTAPLLQELAQTYGMEHGDDVIVVTAASSVLARQIEHGAPADLFLSANRAWADHVADIKSLPKSDRLPIFHNQLSLIVHKSKEVLNAPLESAAFEALLQGGHLAICDPNGVPCGIYGKESLGNLGLWAAAQDHLIIGNNARATLAWVERQEAIAGIVYQTDSQSSQRVKTAAILPAASHEPILYELAVLSPDREAVTRFVAYLRGEEGMAAAQRYGFVPIAPDQ